MSGEKTIQSRVISIFIEPARARGEKMVTLRAGEIQKMLGPGNKISDICDAVDAQEFLEEAQVELKGQRGAAHRTDREWDLRLIPMKEGTQSDSGLNGANIDKPGEGKPRGKWGWTDWALKVVIPAIAAIIATVVIITNAWQAKQNPTYEIFIRNPLPGQPDTVEVTDRLIGLTNNHLWEDYAVSAVVDFEVRPTYSGQKKYGSVYLKVGDNGTPKSVWENFDKESGTATIPVSLEEIIRQSKIQPNDTSTSTSLHAGDPEYQTAQVKVSIYFGTDPSRIISEKLLTIKNTPWDIKAKLLWENGKPYVNYHIRNMGADGEFALHWIINRLDKDIDSNESLFSWSGVTQIADSPDTAEFFPIKSGEYFSGQIELPNEYASGRYVVIFYTFKKQNYVAFTQPGEDWTNYGSDWLFSDASTWLTFVQTKSNIPVDSVIQKEVDRVKNDDGFDIGEPTGPSEEKTSSLGTIYQVQPFEHGEVYQQGENAYVMYGSIFEAYKKKEQLGYYGNGYPIGPIQKVKSGLDTEGEYITLEGLGGVQPPSVLYVSEKGSGMTQGWIAYVYEKNGGPAGWLGFPISDIENRAYSEIQMFEAGYMVYFYPETEEESERWDHEPVAFPYIGGSANVIVIKADQSTWLDTGLDVEPGQRVHVVQLGGGWRYDPEGDRYDANGGATIIDYSLLPNYPVGMLIGKIGDDGEKFPIGRWRIVNPQKAGRLYLIMNDSEGDFEDNTGSIYLQVFVFSD